MDARVYNALAPRYQRRRHNTVAIYYLSVKSFGGSANGRATSAAAYRSGERIRDERTGKVFDHSHRNDVMHKEIVLPSKLAAADMSWARDRATLWNAAELVESRKNAGLAREYLVALPHELTHGQRLGLVQTFSRDLADRHGFAVDFAIHAPRPDNDPRNFHAHLLATTREVLPTGLGAKTDLELSFQKRHERGLGTRRKEMLAVRERWATLTNKALQMANLDVRVDHRRLRAQGIDREPVPYMAIASQRSENLGRENEMERAVARVSSTGSVDALEEVRRLARQSWLQLRDARCATSAAPESARTKAHDSQQECDVGRGERDDDLAL
jgi:ATP-dependent exoDNAse (exonuclease V) alpha subunit